MMKKLIAIVLVTIMVVVIDQKPWREDDVTPAANTGSNYSYSGYNSYGYNYDYDRYAKDDSFTMECYRCHGSGRCEDFGGSGRSKLTGVLAASRCALCAASGRCYKCNGKGYTVHY